MTKVWIYLRTVIHKIKKKNGEKNHRSFFCAILRILDFNKSVRKGINCPQGNNDNKSR